MSENITGKTFRLHKKLSTVCLYNNRPNSVKAFQENIDRMRREASNTNDVIALQCQKSFFLRKISEFLQLLCGKKIMKNCCNFRFSTKFSFNKI